MKNINTSPISGTQELLPEKQAIFNSLKTKINEVYESHGFFNIEAPILERTEVLKAKAGSETEKQIYNVYKTAEEKTDSTEALRFDHTVPLARYIIEHENNLVFPLKVSQLGLNFRGERAQKGRFREFYQCDIDILGRNSLPISYDTDIISTLLDTYNSFELKTPVIARINNRKILSGLIEFLNLQEKSSEIYSIIDHSEKVSPEKTKNSFTEIGLSENDIKKILAFIGLHGERAFVIKNLNSLNINNELFMSGVSELDAVLSLLEATGYTTQISADMRIVRGLDYYTGTVFEFMLPEYKEIGSIGGGGRYENLTSRFSSNHSFPGVGGSIGLTRLFFVLDEYGLLRDNHASLIDYAIIPLSNNEIPYATKIAKALQDQKLKTSLIMTDKKLGDKISYATKFAKFGIIIGEIEANSKTARVKDFETGEEKVVDAKPLLTNSPSETPHSV
ncbi:histidine--tRNA ligase [Candidatus Saccharibacteria bacterium]|nr:histidine--tRNA ligase [Candidatus Saccharibacteria bacterium]